MLYSDAPFRARFSAVLLIALVLLAGCSDDTQSSVADAQADGADSGDVAKADGEDAADASEGDTSDSAPDVSPVDCAQVRANGWELCVETDTICGFVVNDSTGCNGACATLRLRCQQSFENERDRCLPERNRPALECAETGRISEYCVCARN